MKVDYIRTFSGTEFTIFEPQIKQIMIIDIAHALSHLCRYGGHSNKFYSVAQHSIATSYLVKPENALCGLLHDATEAYLVDMPKPIKYKMDNYRIMEDNLYAVIAEKFNLPLVIPDNVHEIDSKMIWKYEWDYFMLNNPQKKHKDFYKSFFENKNPGIVRSEFLRRFQELVKMQNKHKTSLKTII